MAIYILQHTQYLSRDLQTNVQVPITPRFDSIVTCTGFQAQNAVTSLDIQVNVTGGTFKL